MFAVGHVLASDDLLDAAFACDLGACRGACCVDGERGAPLEKEELPAIESALAFLAPELRPEARDTAARVGGWEGNDRKGYATTTVDDRECVFVVYDRGIATCAIQRAFNAGRIDWEKPISCHLYPIRVECHGEGEDAIEILNYETIEVCAPGRAAGRRGHLALVHMLERPLKRRYGPAWYARFIDAWRERRADLGIRDGLDDSAEPAIPLTVLPTS